MRSNQTRVFTENGEQYSFNSKAFRSRIDSVAKATSVSKGQVAEDLATKLSLTTDAINNWKYEKNGPADLDTVKKSAELLHTDWHRLVRKISGGSEMNQLTDRQKEAVKRVYDVLIWFLEVFNNTTGFNDWWSEFAEKGSKNPKNDIYERAERMEDRVRLVLNQEYFDLHNLEIYNELCEFASEDLVDMYDEKVGYGYRYEAVPGEDPTTWDDYEKAMNKLNDIIEKYV